MTHFSTDYEQGIKDEQERILKLLEQDDFMVETDRIHVIALIKGEQK